MQRLLRSQSLQPKLAVRPAGDPYEQEADRLATLAVSAAQPAVQRKCGCGGGEEEECEECRAARLGVQRSASGEGAPSAAPPLVHNVVRGGGKPLDPSTRGYMESRLGQDFRGVRVHTDSQAARSARAIGALAYTVGEHIAFDQGRFQPGTGAGRRLLSHELVHVVQQRGGRQGVQRQAAGSGPILMPGEGVLRPEGLPFDQAYQLYPLEGLPEELANSIPENQLAYIDFTSLALASFGQPGFPGAQGPGSPLVAPEEEPGFITPGDVLRGGGAGTFFGPIPYLQTYGFAAAGDSAVGIVAIGRAGSPGHFMFGHPLLSEADAWGHTATYVREGGKIKIVRGFTIQSLLEVARDEPAFRAGRPTAAAIADDVALFTKTGAKSLEYRVPPALAEAYARGLPMPGAVQPGSGIPTMYSTTPTACTSANCVSWALQQMEEGLGGRVGPQSPAQGDLMKFLKRGDFPEVPRGSTPTVGGMSRGMQVLRWGGRFFLVLGIASVPVETALAPEGQRARTAVGASGGLAAGLVAGAWGAKAGLACGPYAIICSPVAAIGAGFFAAIGGRAIAEAFYDFFTSSSPDTFVPNYCGECPSCHCVPRPKFAYEDMPALTSLRQTLQQQQPSPVPHQLSDAEMRTLIEYMKNQ